MNFESLADETVLELYKKTANNLSFYNAAEGNSWYEERSACLACSAELKEITKELEKRNIKIPQGNWLI